MTSEQEAMQIIKSYLRPLVRAVVELVKESWSEKEVAKEDKATVAPAPAPVVPTPAPVADNPLPEYRAEPPRREPGRTPPPPKREPSEAEIAWQVYQALPERLQTSLRGLLGGDDVSAFENPAFSIERLWDFCKTEVQRPDGLDNSRELAHIFEFFFARIASQGQDPLFLYEPPAGEKYDPKRMTASNAGKKIGAVEHTILKGYYSAQEHDGDAGDDMGAIKHKAVVVLQ